jgi:hypothetical protein
MKAKYIHIPKTAGTSVSFAMGVDRDHRTFRELRDKEGVKGDYVFACVRNPYDRAVSCYYFIKQIVGVARSEGHSFPHFTDDAEDVSDFWANHTGGSRFQMLFERIIYLKPQYRWLENSYSGDISGRVDFIMRYENLVADWSHIQDLFGYQDLGKENESVLRAGQNWGDVLSHEAKLRISSLYAQDFARFGYSDSGV